MKPLSSAFSPEVLAELARPVEIRDPRHAEIIEGRSPLWFVVEVYASEQANVAAALQEHRFGLYVPEVDETIIRRGRRIDRRVPMFSGYVFVFMWPNDQHWRWISDTPGVVGIIGALSDAEIDIVRAIENGKRPVVIELPQDAEEEPVVRRPRAKKKRRWKNRRSAKAKAKPKPVTEADLRNEIITTRAWSAFDDILELDSEGRNQTLMRALGLS